MVKQKEIPFIKCGKRLLFIVSELEDCFFRKVEIDTLKNPSMEPGRYKEYLRPMAAAKQRTKIDAREENCGV